MSARPAPDDLIARRRPEMALSSLVRGLSAQTLFGSFAAVAAAVSDHAAEPLFPSEEKAVEWASAARRATFASGRFCARAALASLGRPPAAIPRGTAGEPLWPPGVVGSIAHTETFAAAVVADDRVTRAVGLDVEDDSPLDDATSELVCRPDEIPPSLPASLPRLRFAKLLFAIKEAVYKCHWPVERAFLEFEDVHVAVDFAAEGFRARVATAKAGRNEVIEGVFANAGGLFVALAVLLRAD